MHIRCLALGVLLAAPAALAGPFDGTPANFELDYAPTTRPQAEFASWAAFVAGFLPLVVTSTVQSTPHAGDVTAIVGGIATSALWSFGPNVGDAANGDWQRFWYHGLGRLALCGVSAGAFGLANLTHAGTPSAVLMLVSGGAGIGTLVWAIIDLVDSGGAPQRWMRRYHEREPADPE
jgi:hypothetical protein